MSDSKKLESNIIYKLIVLNNLNTPTNISYIESISTICSGDKDVFNDNTALLLLSINVNKFLLVSLIFSYWYLTLIKL